MRLIAQEKIYRIIDANANRAKEGLRVCEDVARFILDDRKSSEGYKRLRHQLEKSITSLPVSKKILIGARDIAGDVGTRSISAELKRGTVKDIFFANSQRIKESIRVLEEFSKLMNTKAAQSFKTARYKIYALEKNIIKKL